MSQPSPNDSDAILGGQNPQPIDAAVLGGVEGVKQQIAKEWGLSYELVDRFSFETVFVNDNAEIIDRQQKQAFCYTVDINGVPLELVCISAGSFLMGGCRQTDYQLETQLAQPIHLVTLESFFMGKYPVTQKQYLALMGMNPSRYQADDRHPVEEMSWRDAMEFCERLSKLTSKKFTLPSESQWEYACRAGTDTDFCFGRQINTKLANYDDLENDKYFRSRGRTTPVGIFSPNSWGLYDVHGNVREWCLDKYYHHGYIGAPLDGSAWSDFDTNDRSCQSYRSFRSGSWNDRREECMSYTRGLW